MCECNYSEIALIDNKVTGVMLAHITTSYFDFRYFMLIMLSAFRLSFHSEGRKCFEILKNISVCEKEIQKAVKASSNRLLLLIIDKNMRNCGIGSALINDLQQKCKSYHLITDTLCNYQYVIHELNDIKKRLLSFAEYAKNAQPEVLFTLIHTIVDRIYITTEGSTQKCQIYIKGCATEDYSDLFGTADYIERNAVVAVLPPLPGIRSSLNQPFPVFRSGPMLSINIYT